MKNLIIQLNIVPDFIEEEKLTSFSFMKEMYDISERNSKKYALKNKADYYKITKINEWVLGIGKHLAYQKFKIYDFAEYDNIFYIDSDYIIKDNAPNIFEIADNKFCAAVDNGKSVFKLASDLKIPADRYFNTGLMLFPKNVLDQTRDVLPEYLKQEWKLHDQGFLNKIFYDRNVSINKLNPLEWNNIAKTFALYGDHYSGTKKHKWGSVFY